MGKDGHQTGKEGPKRAKKGLERANRGPENGLKREFGGKVAVAAGELV